MSFYSSLELAANDGVRTPQPGEVYDLLVNLNVINRGNPEADDFSLSKAVEDLFRDEVANNENTRFFFPTSGICFSTGLEINGPDGMYEGPGWSLKLHGYGYFWPWELKDLRDRVIRSPILINLRSAMKERFGGRFVFPDEGSELLLPRVIDGDSDGWIWFPSEDVY